MSRDRLNIDICTGLFIYRCRDVLDACKVAAHLLHTGSLCCEKLKYVIQQMLQKQAR